MHGIVKKASAWIGIAALLSIVSTSPVTEADWNMLGEDKKIDYKIFADGTRVDYHYKSNKISRICLPNGRYINIGLDGDPKDIGNRILEEHRKTSKLIHEKFLKPAEEIQSIIDKCDKVIKPKVERYLEKHKGEVPSEDNPKHPAFGLATEAGYLQSYLYEKFKESEFRILSTIIAEYREDYRWKYNEGEYKKEREYQLSQLEKAKKEVDRLIPLAIEAEEYLINKLPKDILKMENYWSKRTPTGYRIKELIIP